MPISAVAVYCGSSSGRRADYSAAARRFGVVLAERGIRLIYGGGHVGLMGVLADAAIRSRGDVLGVITRALVDKEVAHTGLPNLCVVDTMHERKAAMADAADAFVMLPGGFGTFDEFFEMLTWTQLGLQSKPCGILDVEGFFEPLRHQIDRAVDSGFVRPEHRDLVLVASEPAELLDLLGAWVPVAVEKWIDRADR